MELPGDKEDRGGIILAGGNSARFGGLDKTLVDLGNGKTLIEVVAGRLKFLDEVVVSTSSENRAEEYHRATGLETVVDSHPGILGGVLAGCRTLSTRTVFVAGADMPFLKENVIRCQFLVLEGFQAVVPVHPNGFIEPLHVTIERIPAICGLEKLCRAGVRRVSRLFDRLKTYYIPVEELTRLDPQLDCFTNINDEKTLRSIFRDVRPTLPPARNSRSSSSESARAFTSSLKRD